ncbi:hypothetical protein Tco_0307724 [Tanacetum coccineum]
MENHHITTTIIATVVPTIAPKTILEIETTLDPTFKPDTSHMPSEAPLSPDYVPASPDYVLASLDYFPESDLEEPPEEDPSKDDPFGDDVSEIAELKVQAASTPPAPLQIVRAIPVLPRQPINVVLPGQEIPFGRPYQNTRWITAPPSPSSDSSLEYSLVASSYVGPSHWRSRYVSSSPSPPPRKRCRVLLYSSSSALFSPPLSVGPSRKFKGSPTVLHHEETIEDTIKVVVEPVILPIHAEPTNKERLDEHEQVIQGMYENLIEMYVIRFEEIEEQQRAQRDKRQLRYTKEELRSCQIVLKNGNGNENKDENSNGDVNGNRNEVNGNTGGLVRAAHECTYKEFLNCQPLNFKGTEGAVGLAKWFKKMESILES